MEKAPALNKHCDKCEQLKFEVKALENGNNALKMTAHMF